MKLPIGIWLVAASVSLTFSCSESQDSVQPPSQAVEKEEATSEVVDSISEKGRDDRVLEMDELILAVHEDLKVLRRKHEWLVAYGDTCLWDGKSIFFMPKQPAENGPMPQQPDQIYIGYGRINAPKGPKYSNDLEDETLCHFSSLNSRIYANLVIRGQQNAGLREDVKQTIIGHCRTLQERLKTK